MAAKLQLTLVNETEANNGSDIKVVPTKLHILAVDDNSIDRRLIEMLLKTSAYQVTAVDSAVRALEVLGLGDTCHQRNACPVNLIITDYRMPGMTGYDLLKKVKETSVLKEIPVIIMSSENSTARIKRCLAEGAEEFILKPVKIADVKRLRGHIRPPLNDFFVDQPSISNHAKRKVALEGVPKRTSKRRPRLEGVIIVP